MHNARAGRTEPNLARFLCAFVGYGRWRVAGAALLVACGALLDGVGLLMLVPVLDLAMRPAGGAAPPAWERMVPAFGGLADFGPTARLLFLLAAFVGLMAIRSLALSMRDRTLGRLQIEFVEDIRARLVDRLATVSWSRVARVNHASVVQALSVEIHQVGIAANSFVLASVSAVLLAGHCLLALVLAPLAGTAAILFGIVGFAVSRFFLRDVRSLGQSITRAHFDMTESAIHFLAGLKFAAAQGLTGDFVRDHYAVATRAVGNRLDFLRLQTSLRDGTSALAALAGAGMLFAGIAVFHLAPAVLVTLLLVLSRMLGPAQAIQQAMQQVLQTLPAYAAVRDLERTLTLPEADSRVPARTPARNSSASDGISLSGVTLRHGASAPVLQGLDLDVPRGAFVGVSGPSGCGKTSFLDLLAGLLPPQGGEVRVLDRDLAGATDLAAHRGALAYVGQDPFLLDGSIRRNLGWSRGDVTEEEMWHALEMVEAVGVVRRLEGGLDGRTGESGTLLSAGERQRLALARAVLRNPELLLLDEATNALDVEGERRILEALKAMTPQVTIFLVAHRWESLGCCDHILRFPGPVLQEPLRVGGEIRMPR